MPLERVQKILSRAGISSRRKAEELILSGEVTINGRVARLGDKAELGKDFVKVRGKLVHSAQAPVYLAFFKPKGVISALSDPNGRPCLSDFLKRVKARVYPVGRLDYNSEGLLILTNDGSFTEEVLKRNDIPRVYHVKVRGHPTAEMLARLEKGARIPSRGVVRPQEVRVAEELANKSRVEITFAGGALDVKKYFEMKGFLVERVLRVAIGTLRIGALTPGAFKYLRPSQVEHMLKRAA